MTPESKLLLKLLLRFPADLAAAVILLDLRVVCVRDFPDEPPACLRSTVMQCVRDGEKVVMEDVMEECVSGLMELYCQGSSLPLMRSQRNKHWSVERRHG